MTFEEWAKKQLGDITPDIAWLAAKFDAAIAIEEEADGWTDEGIVNVLKRAAEVVRESK